MQNYNTLKRTPIQSLIDDDDDDDGNDEDEDEEEEVVVHTYGKP